MQRWINVVITLVVVLMAVTGLSLWLFQTPPDKGETPRPDRTVRREVQAAENATPGAPGAAATGAKMVGDFNCLPIPDSHVAVMWKQDVPSQRDGQLLYVATDEFEKDKVYPKEDLIDVPEVWVYRPAKEGETVPESDRLAIADPLKKEPRVYRRLLDPETPSNDLMVQMVPGLKKRHLRLLKVGDEVREGQLLALVDPSLTLAEFDAKRVGVQAAKADFKASEKTRDEARERYNTQQKLYQTHSCSYEDLRGAELTWFKYVQEAVSKDSAIGKAEAEMRQALTTLKLHQVFARRSGTINKIEKQSGEAVKNLETLLQIQHYDRVQVRGEVGPQHVNRLKEGDQVVVEPFQQSAPIQVLSGHEHEIRGVAVSRDRAIVSAGDQTVRVWKYDAKTSQHQEDPAVLYHPAEVRAVACTPKESKGNLCLSGAADGAGRIWDLDHPDNKPLELKERHKGPINCVAFSPDGAWCATGATDRDVCVWSTATGDRLLRIPSAHLGEVLSLQFFKHKGKTYLVSAGNDQVKLWTLSATADGVELEGTAEKHDRRGSEVTALGVNPQGGQGIIDYGKELRIVALPGGHYEGSLANPSAAMNFTTMALFSPDGNAILTASGSEEGRLQLWRAPTSKSRAYEMRQLVWNDRDQATCGAFDPDDSFLVTGSRSGNVVVWAMPTPEELAVVLKAKITLVDQSFNEGSRIRVWAELDNPKMSNGRRRLIPGNAATMVFYPNQK
jgi:biotin carboxyl carrier protein